MFELRESILRGVDLIAAGGVYKTNTPVWMVVLVVGQVDESRCPENWLLCPGKIFNFGPFYDSQSSNRGPMGLCMKQLVSSKLQADEKFQRLAVVPVAQNTHRCQKKCCFFLLFRQICLLSSHGGLKWESADGGNQMKSL